MANTYKALQTVTVGSGGAASISFTGIPQTYTDLVIQASVRDNSAFTAQTFAMRINGVSGTSYTWLRLQGNGATASSDAFASQDAMVAGATNAATSTSNTFNNSNIYVPNYAGNINNKTVSFDSVSENNATTAFAQLNTGLFFSSSPVTSITLYSTSGNLVQYSTFTLYGVFNADVSLPPATPTIGTATAGINQASITFTGVSNAASYTMTSSPGSISATGTTSPITVTGLTAGTAYTFTVTAANPFGTSGSSAASNSVTPTSTPVWSSWTQTTLLNTRNFPHVTYKNSIWMAPQFFVPGSPPGNYGEDKVWTSSNGTSWTQRNLPSAQQWRVPQYANGIWVLATDGTPYATSTDNGVSWTARTYAGLNAQPGDSAPSAMFWGGFGSSTGYYTTDGVNLTARTHTVTQPIYNIFAFNKWHLFPTATDAPNYSQSTDVTAATWTNRTLPASGSFYNAAFNGTVILVMNVGTTQAYTSTDGVNWTSRTLPMNAEEGSIYAPTSGGSFVIVARSSSSAFTSDDGITWTARNLPSGSASNTRSISAPSGTYVISSSNGQMSTITKS